MAKFHITTIHVLQKVKRLDGSVDHHIHVITKDNEYNTVIRLSGTQALSVYFETTKCNSRIEWVKLPRKRTLKACISALAETTPQILNDDGYERFLTLQEDDHLARSKQQLAKRQWRVHSVARWPNGYFVARLSCTRYDKNKDSDTQFILYPTSVESYNFPEKDQIWQLSARHGSMHTASDAPARVIYNGLWNKKAWPALSQALSGIEYGYSSELEAQAGFDHIVAKQIIPPKSIDKFKSRNAIKQRVTNDTISVKILDTYHAYKEQAWLIDSTLGYFIMRTDKYIPGKVSLRGHSVSTTLTDTLESAKRLISMCKHTQRSESNVKHHLKEWRELIALDANTRYFIEQVTATWLITHIALETDTSMPMAVMAACYPEPSLAIPAQFSGFTYRILYLKDGQLVDPSIGDEAHYTKQNCDLFLQAIVGLLEDLDNATAREALIEMLLYSSGYSDKAIAEQTWKTITHEYNVQVLEGDACPLPAAIKTAQFHHINQQKRVRLLQLISEGRSTSADLVQFDREVKEQLIYPEQLIDLGISKGWLSPKDAKQIQTIKKEHRNDLAVDVFESLPNRQLDIPPKDTVETIKISKPEPGEEHSEKLLITSKLKSNVGRKRIHKDDKERKRVWAQNKRKEQRKKQRSEGVKTAKAGRIKEYGSAAERQKSYRLRQKWSSLSVGATLLIVDVQHDLSPNTSLLKMIEQLIPFYRGNVYATHYISAKNNSKHTLLDKVTNENGNDGLAISSNLIDNKNVYTKTSLSLSVKIIKQLKGRGLKSVHLCGVGLSSHCYAVAMSLFDAGIQPYIYKDLCQGSPAEKKLALQLFRKHFGKHCVI